MSDNLNDVLMAEFSAGDRIKEAEEQAKDLIRAERGDRCPTKPSELLRDTLDYLRQSRGMSVSEIATRLNVTRQTLHRITSEDGSISIEMAHRIGRFLGNGPGLWIRMQAAYDLWQFQNDMPPDIESIVPLAPTTSCSNTAENLSFQAIKSKTRS